MSMSNYDSDYDMFDPDADDIVSREVIEHPPPSTNRSHGRLAALQAMYEIDVTKHPIGEVINRTLDANPEALSIKTFVIRLVMETQKLADKLDEILQEYAPEFPLKQVAVVDRNILRLALYEATFEEHRSINIVVGEAVWLARLFGADGSISFVNGVLGNIAHDMDEIREKLKAEEI